MQFCRFQRRNLLQEAVYEAIPRLVMVRRHSLSEDVGRPVDDQRLQRQPAQGRKDIFLRDVRISEENRLPENGTHKQLHQRSNTVLGAPITGSVCMEFETLDARGRRMCAQQ